MLNKEQLAAATFTGKHLLVLAGAGTGKTRTIIARAIHLLNNGVAPDRIKILSFTRKSAQEIVNRIKIESTESSIADSLKGSTFHAWCMELIQHYPKDFGLEGFSCIDADDQETAFKLVMGRAFGNQIIKLHQRCRLTPSVIQAICSFAINTRCSLSDSICAQLHLSKMLKRHQELIEESRQICQRIIQDYIEYKKNRHYLDYDDMLAIVAFALKNNDSLRKKISALYEHILIDEMQDTNPLQWMLLESFYDNCHLFCVGDDAQSIYAFRGADFKSIHSFKDKVPDGDIFKLTENYRSTQEILDLSNWVLNKSPLRYGKDLIAHRGHGKKPMMFLLNSDWEEANIVTSIIQKGIVEGRRYTDYLVLARGAFSCRRIEAACITKGIPYKFYGGTQLMKSAHVRDVMSALRIVTNHKDELAWTRYLTIWPGIGDVKAANFTDIAMKQHDIQSAVSSISIEKGQCQDIKDILISIMNCLSEPSKAIDIVVKKMEKLLSKKYDNWDIRKSDFDALKIVAIKCANIYSFITEYVLDPTAEQTRKNEDKSKDDFVIISTIHSAKGLEADTCFVIDVSPASYPSIKAVTDDEVEEERRCLYVALTRAKNSLNIMSRKHSISSISLNGTTFYSSPYCNEEVGQIISVTPNWNEEKRVLEQFFLIEITATGERITMEREQFMQLFYLKSDNSINGNRYFLNGIKLELIDYYTESMNNDILDSGYDSEWSHTTTNGFIDMKKEFDFN